MHIIPAIIPTSFTHLRESLALFSGVTTEFQIDIVDGVFATPASWPYTDGRVATAAEELAACTLPYSLELDVMVQEPAQDIVLYAASGIRRIIVHAESTVDLDMLLARARETGVAVGLALNNDTPLSVVRAHIGAIDFIQCMGIAEVGAQGHPFDERVLARIHELRASYPDCVISVDGGVSHDTLARLKDVGAQRFVVGSAIFKAEDPVAAYRELASMVA